LDSVCNIVFLNVYIYIYIYLKKKKSDLLKKPRHPITKFYLYIQTNQNHIIFMIPLVKSVKVKDRQQLLDQ
jgi:hypothetical protein